MLANLESAGFAGALYLINPKRSEIYGRPCLPSVEALPEGVDCAVLAIPRASVLETVSACGRRGVGAAIIFSAGFAESGPVGRLEQEELAAIARACGLIIEGPNCLGMVNFIDGIPLTFVLTPPARYQGNNGVAIVSQSGAMAAVVGVSLRARELNISFSISTGNEVISGVEDYVEYLLEDPCTSVMLMIVEQFRNPRRFLDAADRVRERGKHIVLLHPGRSSAARASAETHTGAMAGDYQVMRTQVEHAGVIVAETLEELLDVSELVLRCPSLPMGGTAVLTESGAFKALTLDLCDQVSLPLPELSTATAEALRQVLPDFIPPTNPLDVTAQALVDPDLYRRTLPSILADDRYGSLVLAIILTDETTSSLKLPPIIDAVKTIRPNKPVIFAGLDEGAQIPIEFVRELRRIGIPFFPTPERAFRALARLTNYIGRWQRHKRNPLKVVSTFDLVPGVLPEYKSKSLLHSIGISVPAGTLATTLDEAGLIAERIGYPVALKAQSPYLSHKSDLGGVALNLVDEQHLASAWKLMHEKIARCRPGLGLDGVLVEAMAVQGIELIVGAKNDPDWGPVLLVGSGGILAEAMQDSILIAPQLSVSSIVGELYKLKCAPLLRGYRGSPALDVEAAAQIVYQVAGLTLSNPQIKEIDINPVVVYPKGDGALALDALIVLT